jgi:RNA polymerase sigma factor (sigma-70 family)
MGTNKQRLCGKGRGMREFQEIYETYNQHIFRYLLKITDCNRDLAEELTQETFFQVYLSLPRYRGESGMLTWICSIAKHVCYKHYKKNPRTVSLDINAPQILEIASLKPQPLEVVEQREISAFIIEKIMRMKQKYRDVLIYRLFFELSYQEIGELMRVKENSAKVLFFRAKEQVRKEVARVYDKDRE